MAHSHEFEFGSGAVLFLDTERSVHTGDRRRPTGGTRSVTLYVKNPGDMFKAGSNINQLRKRVKKALEDLHGVCVGVVNQKYIVLYDDSIRTYDDGADVATDFVTVFNEQHKQLLAAAERMLSPN